MGVFVDANCFKGYVDALISGTFNNCRVGFEAIQRSSCVVLDTGGIFEQEWRDCTGAESNIFIRDHIADLMQQGKVILMDYKRDSSIKKKLKEVGIPKRDARIVEFCVGANVFIINTNDIDLYDPKFKGCNAARHHKIAHERGGSICRMIEKTYKLVVCCCCRVPEFLNS